LIDGGDGMISTRTPTPPLPDVGVSAPVPPGLSPA
jgi:hypothetical protein